MNDERSDNIRTVTLEILIEDSTTVGANEFVAYLNGVEIEAFVPSEGGTYVGVVQRVEEAPLLQKEEK